MALTSTRWSGIARLQSASENTPPMRFGEADHNATVVLQEVLIENGFSLPSGPDGIYGQQTAAAVQAAEVQFGEFGAVGVPLEHHHLRPVMPDWSSQNDVLIDPDVAILLRALRDGQMLLAKAAILAAVGIGKIDRTLVVEGFMYCQATGIGVMSSEIAARRRLERQRQHRARRAIADYRRKNPCFQAAGDRRGIGGIDEILRSEAGDDLVLDRIRNVGAVPDAGVGIEKGIQRHGTKLRVINPLCVLLQQIHGGLHQWRA